MSYNVSAVLRISQYCDLARGARFWFDPKIGAVFRMTELRGLMRRAINHCPDGRGQGLMGSFADHFGTTLNALL